MPPTSKPTINDQQPPSFVKLLLPALVWFAWLAVPVVEGSMVSENVGICVALGSPPVMVDPVMGMGSVIVVGLSTAGWEVVVAEVAGTIPGAGGVVEVGARLVVGAGLPLVVDPPPAILVMAKLGDVLPELPITT